MGTVASIIGGAVGAAVGIPQGSKGSTLEDFLSKFSDPGGRYVNTLDPLGTFDVSFTFFPCDPPSDDSGDGSGIGQALGQAATSAARGALDTVTGGLFSAASSPTESVMDMHDSFKKAGVNTFVEYLAEANGLVGGENWFSSKGPSSPLELQLGLYVQNIQVPNIRAGGDNKANSALGEFPTAGSLVIPDSTLQMTIVNTKAALHERLFYPWMRETTLPYWSYLSQPFTTATVVIDYTKHNDVKYVFTGVRPIQINMMHATQDASGGDATRDVTFAFDFMFILSELNTVDSSGDKLFGSAGSLASGAANMIGF